MSKDLTKQIDRLKTYSESPAPILSIYFQLPVPKKYTTETIVNKLQTHINANLSYEQREEMMQQIQMIVGFMETYQQARGENTLAFFSGGNNLFEVMHLPYKMKSSVTVSHSPHLEPLLIEQEDSRRYLVILSDKKNAMFYTIAGGTVEDNDKLFDESVPQDINHIGSQGLRTQRDDKTQRHVHEHMLKHFSYIAKRAEDFIKNKKIDGVILGGHKNELNQFKEQLPRNLKEKVIGDFVTELHTNAQDILKKSSKIIDNFTTQIRQAPATA
jgi:peptide chain release factor subunit 1